MFDNSDFSGKPVIKVVRENGYDSQITQAILEHNLNDLAIGVIVNDLIFPDNYDELGPTVRAHPQHPSVRLFCPGKLDKDLNKRGVGPVGHRFRPPASYYTRYWRRFRNFIRPQQDEIQRSTNVGMMIDLLFPFFLDNIKNASLDAFVKVFWNEMAPHSES